MTRSTRCRDRRSTCASARRRLPSPPTATCCWRGSRASAGSRSARKARSQPPVASTAASSRFSGLGAPLRDTDDVAPLFLADGRAAVAWTDSSPRARDGRLHLAAEGAAAPVPPRAPRLTVHRSAPQRLFDNQPVRVDVSCDVRARRRGKAIVVTWRTAAPARRQRLLAQARTTPDGDGYDSPGIVRRHPWVAVIAEGWDAGGLDGPERVVRVTG